MGGGHLRHAAEPAVNDVPATTILDIDGTLVDTNYQHALAWYRAFRRHGIVLPLYRIHRHIGMGGDQLVQAITSREVEERQGDEIRAAETELYNELIGEAEPMRGARELLVGLKEHGSRVVLASSAKEPELEHYLDLLEARDVADGWTSSADVGTTKPAPDLVQVALDRAGADPSTALMVGDATWDALASRRAGVQAVAVLTGGFSEQELREAGASDVFESLDELASHLLGTREHAHA